MKFFYLEYFKGNAMSNKSGAHVCISGYNTKKDVSSMCEEAHSTCRFYYEKHGILPKELVSQTKRLGKWHDLLFSVESSLRKTSSSEEIETLWSATSISIFIINFLILSAIRKSLKSTYGCQE